MGVIVGPNFLPRRNSQDKEPAIRERCGDLRKKLRGKFQVLNDIEQEDGCGFVSECTAKIAAVGGDLNIRCDIRQKRRRREFASPGIVMQVTKKSHHNTGAATDLKDAASAVPYSQPASVD